MELRKRSEWHTGLDDVKPEGGGHERDERDHYAVAERRGHRRRHVVRVNIQPVRAQNHHLRHEACNNMRNV